jgi:hypothetical protein
MVARVKVADGIVEAKSLELCREAWTKKLAGGNPK